MENFKLDLTQLTPVEEADRIKGNWYVVADNLNERGTIRQWHSGNYSMEYYYGSTELHKYWFLIPPGLPGFPVAELPDVFVLNKGEWEYTDKSGKFIVVPVNSIFRKIKHLPELTIPSGTKAEQIEAVKKLLNELETK
jgi:hypothetical protein